jgi:hypothetical protein
MHVSDPDAWFIFNLHRELFLFEHTYVFEREHVCILIKGKETHLLGKEVLLSWQQIFHPFRSLAQSQLPCTPCVFPDPRARYTHTENLFLYTKMTLTSLILLSGKLILNSVSKPKFYCNSSVSDLYLFI